MFCPWWSLHRSDDAIATRVTLDIEAQTADTITTVLFTGYQSPVSPKSATPSAAPARPGAS